jgi:hypothetical protein
MTSLPTPTPAPATAAVAVATPASASSSVTTSSSSVTTSSSSSLTTSPKLALILNDVKMSKDTRQSKLTKFLYQSLYDFLRLLKHAIPKPAPNADLKRVRSLLSAKSRFLSGLAKTPLASRTMLRSLVPMLLPWGLPLAPFAKSKDERILLFIEAQMAILLESDNAKARTINLDSLWKTLTSEKKQVFWQNISDQIDVIYRLVLLDPNLYISDANKAATLILLQNQEKDSFEFTRNYFLDKSDAGLKKWLASTKTTSPSPSTTTTTTTTTTTQQVLSDQTKTPPIVKIAPPLPCSSSSSQQPTSTSTCTHPPPPPPSKPVASAGATTAEAKKQKPKPQKDKKAADQKDLMQDVLKFMKSSMGEQNNKVVESLIKKLDGLAEKDVQTKSFDSFFDINEVQTMATAFERSLRQMMPGDDDDPELDSEDELNDPNLDVATREKYEALRLENQQTNKQITSRIFDRFIGRPLEAPTDAVAKIEKQVEEDRLANLKAQDKQDLAYLFNFTFVNQALTQVKKVARVTNKKTKKPLFPQLSLWMETYEANVKMQRNTTFLLKSVSRFVKKNRRKFLDQAVFTEWADNNFGEHEEAVKLKLGKLWKLLGKIQPAEDASLTHETGQDVIWQALHTPIKICIMWHFLCSDQALLGINDVLNDIIVAVFKQGASKKHMFRNIRNSLANDHRMNQLKALVHQKEIRENPTQFRRILRVFDLIINQDMFHQRNRLRHKNEKVSESTSAGGDSNSESEGEDDNYDDLTSSDEEDKKKTTTTAASASASSSSSSSSSSTGSSASTSSSTSGSAKTSAKPLTQRELARIQQIDAALAAPTTNPTPITPTPTTPLVNPGAVSKGIPGGP